MHRYAQWFLSRGVEPGHLVAFVMVNSADFMCAWLGLIAIGAAPAMINTNLAARGLLHCINVSKASLVLADGPEEMMEQLGGLSEEFGRSGRVLVRLDEVRGHISRLEPVRPGDELRKAIKPDWPVGLFYTRCEELSHAHVC